MLLLKWNLVDLRVIIKRALVTYVLDFSICSFFQMANLAHRAGQLLQKQYLIIHPTADGNILYMSWLHAVLSETPAT